jgi:hypothetical protein
MDSFHHRTAFRSEPLAARHALEYATREGSASPPPLQRANYAVPEIDFKSFVAHAARTCD